MAVEGLMMIHIAGYDGDAEECFEGISTGALTVTTTTGTGTGQPAIGEPYPETSLPIAPGQDDRPWYIKLLQDFGDVWTPLKATMEGQTPYEEPEETETPRNIKGSRPLPAIIGGALALSGPAQAIVANVCAIQAFVHQATEFGFDTPDPWSERTRLATIAKRLKEIRIILNEAFLRYGADIGGADFTVSRLDDLKNVLKDALTYTAADPDDLDFSKAFLEDIRDALGGEEANKKLVEAIEALQLEVEFADGKASFKRGVFEYAGD
jgi:hypothetical protein